ncbi:probable serine/threonine-protein kinase kinX isoform X2 [Centropristis striata]|uniref:probable serine/threonine-protein kinase kinX isoform X2 n=1 Tax=Centropristis striata TaxID=184440 RepID=UPI0027DEDD40|nr:probable serine/threonine-protein kinase kinX isoform X2 [Centropristis striata]
MSWFQSLRDEFTLTPCETEQTRSDSAAMASGPPDVMANQEPADVVEECSGKKKSKFQTFKKFFARKKRKEPPAAGAGADAGLKGSQSTDNVSKTSENNTLTRSEKEKGSGSKISLGSKALSHDSVFVSDLSEANEALGASQDSIHGKVKSLQLQLKQAIRLGSPPSLMCVKRTDDAGTMSEDDGLPCSPPEYTTHTVTNETQRNSSISLEGIDSDDDQLSCATSSRAVSPLVVPGDFSQPASPFGCLDNSAAKHKLGLRHKACNRRKPVTKLEMKPEGDSVVEDTLNSSRTEASEQQETKEVVDGDELQPKVEREEEEEEKEDEEVEEEEPQLSRRSLSGDEEVREEEEAEEESEAEQDVSHPDSSSAPEPCLSGEDALDAQPLSSSKPSSRASSLDSPRATPEPPAAPREYLLDPPGTSYGVEDKSVESDLALSGEEEEDGVQENREEEESSFLQEVLSSLKTPLASCSLSMKTEGMVLEIEEEEEEEVVVVEEEKEEREEVEIEEGEEVKEEEEEAEVEEPVGDQAAPAASLSSDPTTEEEEATLRAPSSEDAEEEQKVEEVEEEEAAEEEEERVIEQQEEEEEKEVEEEVTHQEQIDVPAENTVQAEEERREEEREGEDEAIELEKEPEVEEEGREKSEEEDGEKERVEEAEEAVEEERDDAEEMTEMFPDAGEEEVAVQEEEEAGDDTREDEAELDHQVCATVHESQAGFNQSFEDKREDGEEKVEDDVEMEHTEEKSEQEEESKADLQQECVETAKPDMNQVEKDPSEATEQAPVSSKPPSLSLPESHDETQARESGTITPSKTSFIHINLLSPSSEKATPFFQQSPTAAHPKESETEQKTASAEEEPAEETVEEEEDATAAVSVKEEDNKPSAGSDQSKARFTIAAAWQRSLSAGDGEVGSTPPSSPSACISTTSSGPVEVEAEAEKDPEVKAEPASPAAKVEVVMSPGKVRNAGTSSPTSPPSIRALSSPAASTEESSVVAEGNPENPFGVRLRKTSTLQRFSLEEETTEPTTEPPAQPTSCKVDSPQPISMKPSISQPISNKPALPKKPDVHGDGGGKTKRMSDPAAARAVSPGSGSPSWISVAKQKQKIYKENSLDEITVRKEEQERKSSLPMYVSSAVSREHGNKAAESTGKVSPLETSKPSASVEKETRRALSPPTPVPPQPPKSQSLPCPVPPKPHLPAATAKPPAQPHAPQRSLSPPVSQKSPSCTSPPPPSKTAESSKAPQTQSTTLTSPPISSRTAAPEKSGSRAAGVPGPTPASQRGLPPQALPQDEPPWMALAKKKAKAWSEMPQIVQ